jgi:hypothetical protein
MTRTGPSSPTQPKPATGAGRNGEPESNGHSGDRDSLKYMEIGGSSQVQRWMGFLTYVLLLAGVCAILVVLFVRFTGSMRLAIGLVVFMVSYMLLMGWWASRGSDRGQ